MVTDEEFLARKAIVSPAMARAQRRRAQSDERLYLSCLVIVGILIASTVATIVYLLFIAPR